MVPVMFTTGSTNAGKPDAEFHETRRLWSRARMDDVFQHRSGPGRSGWLSLRA